MSRMNRLIGLFVVGIVTMALENRSLAQEDVVPCVLYISRAAEVTLDEIRGIANGATISQLPDEKIETRKQPGPRIRTFELTFGVTPLKLFVRDQGIEPKQLDGLSGFLQHQAGQMDQATFHLIRRAQRTSTVLSIVPKEEWNDESLQLVRDLAKEFKALVFSSEMEIVDHEFRTMSGPEKQRDSEAALLEYESAITRRARSFKLLEEKKLTGPHGHPVIVADEEVRLRSAKEVAERAMVLAIVAAHAGAPDPEFANELLIKLGLEKAISDAERAFLNDPKPEADEASGLTWRYEACHALLWAVGLEKKLAFPTEQCDANKIIELLLDPKVKEKLAKATLRPTAELLDEVDLTYRLAWIARQARLNNQPEPISPDIVLERHHAFCWLIRHFNRDWDDVNPDT